MKGNKRKGIGKRMLASVLAAAVVLTGGAFENLKVAKAATMQCGSAGEGSAEAGDVSVCYEVIGEEVAIVGMQYDSSIDVSTAVCDIPNIIEGKPVTTIKTGALCSGSNNIVIGGLSKGTGLPFSKLVIPDNVTTLEEKISKYTGRDNCLTTISIGKGLADINMPIFAGIEMPLSTITVSEKNRTFESRNNAIIEKSTNTLVLGSQQTKIPEDIKGIGSYAFSSISTGDTSCNEGFSSLNRDENGIFIIPTGIESIEKGAFSADITGSVSSVLNGEKIYIPDTVKNIGEHALDGYSGIIFYGDSSATNIGLTISNNTTTDKNFIYAPNGVSGLDTLYNYFIPDTKKAALYIKSKSSAATILSGTTTSKLTLPTSSDDCSELNWPGHKFLGWYLDKGCTKWPVTEIPIQSRGTIPVYAKWEEARTISYNTAANGGTSTAPSDVTAKEDGTDIVDGDDCSFALSTTNYAATKGNTLGTWTHVGWNTDKTAHASGDGEDSSLIVDEDELLYAIFKLDIPVKFTDAQGERTENATLWNTDTSGTITFPSIRAKSGWTPVGWTTSTEVNADTAINVKHPGDTLTVSRKGIVYYALYKKAIKIDTDGDGESDDVWEEFNPSIDPDEGNNGIKAPAEPSVKPGYHFDGWVPDPNPDDETPVQPGGTIAPGDNGIKAVYTPISYSVKFHANNGTTDTRTQNFTYDTAANLDANSFTYSGHRFSGWAASAASGNVVYADRQRVNNLTTTDHATIDLYAVWTADSTDLTPTPTVTPSSTPTTAPTPTVSPTAVPTITPTNTPTASPTAVPTGTPTNTPTSSPTAKPMEYNINYELAGGYFTVLPETSYRAGKVTILPVASMMAKSGYTFGGWYDNKYYVGSPVVSIGQSVVGDQTFYAKWNSASYQIDYVLNGGTLTGYAPASYAAGSIMELPKASDLSKDGYAFAGWYDNSQFIGIPVSSISAGETGNKVYYAKWISKIYSVMLHLNGGKLSSDESFVYGYGDEFTLPIPTREGYSFVGWYERADFSGKAFSKVTISDSDKEFYAKWESIGNTDEKPKEDPDNKNNNTTKIETVGTVITNGKGVYIVNNDKKGETSVTYKETTSKSTVNLVIPDTITINGVVYKVTAISSSLIKNKSKLKSVKIGKYVKRIPNGMFSGCKALTKVTGGKNVVTIGKNAFKNCKKLSKVAMLSNKKLKTIGKTAFLNCKKLKSITIGPKVTKIQNGAFRGCKNLKKITIKSKKLKTVGKNAFKGIHKKCKIKVPASKLKKYKKLLKNKGQKKSVKIRK